MCGIAAAIGQVGRVAELVRAMKHRGPDQSGWMQWDRFALGAARLRITGDARGDQPIEVGQGLAMAVNGEVFNHADLRGSTPEAEASEGDLLPLARGLDGEFPRAIERVRGPFALAALHRKAGLLVLARDERGIRPLHVLKTSDGIVAASEIWPLLFPGEADLDAAALAHLVAFQFLPPGRTLFRAVTSVRPGEAQIFERSGRLVGRQPVRFVGGPGPHRDLAAALREAAALQGPRARKAAIFLSGGLDSSAVLGLLAEAGHPPDLAITGWFPEGDPALDERPHARAVAAGLGIPLLEVPIRAADALEVFPALVRALGGPLAGPGGMAQLLLARAAAEEGVRIVYSGEGGDELFGGYERHRLLQQLAAQAPVVPLPGYGPLARKMSAAHDALAAAVFRGLEMLPLLEREMRLEVAAAAFDALPAPGSGRPDRALEFEIERFLPGLLAVDDATLSAFGIEGRVPLLDPVVASLAASAPLSEKSPPDEPRRLFRSAVGKALPAAAARRSDKMGFPMPLETWLAASPWREYALDRIRPSSLSRFGFDGGKARGAIEASALSPRGTWFLLALDVLDGLLSGRS